MDKDIKDKVIAGLKEAALGKVMNGHVAGLPGKLGFELAWIHDHLTCMEIDQVIKQFEYDIMQIYN